MFAKLCSLGVSALEGFVVTCEVDISGGLPQFAIVGLPDSAVKEATDRVRSALKNLKFEYPVSRITVNLAPAHIKKTGPVYDLPLLLGLLAASGQIKAPPADCAFIGELSLDGDVRPVGGVLPMALACKEAGINTLFLPRANAPEAAVVQGLTVLPLATAREALDHLRGKKTIKPAPGLDFAGAAAARSALPDFADVHGQYEARRAMEIAAAGMHNILLVGPPGTGKSMLAKRLPGILPPMGYAEALEASKIHSVAGLYGKAEGTGLVTARPFRAPHHSVSANALAGGGASPRPGEISLAHNGVLFLDELPEFHRDALEILRQPLEDGTVTVSRVNGNVTYPSRFMLVAAMNPCPCGYSGHPSRECRCGEAAIERYTRKVSGPLLDRIDLHVAVQPVEYDAISAKTGGEASDAMRARVLDARAFAAKRTGGEPAPNATLAGDRLRRDCVMTADAEDALRLAFARLGLSARGYDRVLRVARTIADLDAAKTITAAHVAEAVQYRGMERRRFNE